MPCGVDCGVEEDEAVSVEELAIAIPLEAYALGMVLCLALLFVLRPWQ
jgi:hypothetical protein